MTHMVGAPDGLKERWLAFDHTLENDPRYNLGLKFPNRPVHCRQLVTDQEFHASKIYRELFQPHGFDYTMATIVNLETDGWGYILGLVRKKFRPAWNENDLEKMQLYVPHLRQAGVVSGEFYSKKSISSALEAAFDRIKLATIIVDKDCNIKYSNKSANDILNVGDVIWKNRGKLSLNSPPLANELRQKVFQEATSETLSSPSNGSYLHMPRGSGLRDLRLTIYPLRSDDEFSSLSLNKILYAIIFVTDPDKQYENSVERLQRIFGLSEMEAKILKAYASGISAPRIASKIDRSVETVRTHLKSVREKTGLRTQADLIKSVSQISQ